MRIGLLVATALLMSQFLPGSIQKPIQSAFRQQEPSSRNRSAKPIVIPVTISTTGPRSEAELQTIDLNVTEDGDPQEILSIRARGTSSPITLAVLIQDDLVSSTANETKGLAEFVRQLPKGSRVMVAYIRSGSLQVRQKFTNDLEKAARAIRPPLGIATAGPYNPYVEVIEATDRFVSQPAGRRAILAVSDGLDISRGTDVSSVSDSVDLQRAIKRAQQRSIAIYSIFVPSVTLDRSGSQSLQGFAQSSLQRLSSETGGKPFFQGFGAPVSFDPFLQNVSVSLDKQVALTFLSTHGDKGFHRIRIRSITPGVELNYPAGYVR